MSILLAAFATPVVTVYDLSDLAGSYSDVGGTSVTYSVEIIIRNTNDGTVDVTRGQSANQNNEENYLVPPNGMNLWVQCTQNSGTALNVGDTVGSWVTLESAQSRSFGLSYLSSGPADSISTNIDLDIATDSGGTNIVASRASIVVTVGEI